MGAIRMEWDENGDSDPPREGSFASTDLLLETIEAENTVEIT